MRRRELALTLVFTLLFLVVTIIQITNLASANPNMGKMSRYCDISIQSPQNGTAYNAEPILLNFTAKKVYVSDTYSFFYLLDEQDMQSSVKVEEAQSAGQVTITNVTFFAYTEYTVKGQAVLPKLSNGQHNLTVFIGWMKEDGMVYHANLDPFSATVYFSVDPAAAMPSPSPSPQETEIETAAFLTIPVAVAIVPVVVAAGGIGLIAYRKRKSGKVNACE